MTKAEKNLRLAKLLYPEHEWFIEKGHAKFSNSLGDGWYDFYNNIADLWPHVIEHKISLIFTGYNVYGWQAASEDSSITTASDIKPQEAWADCLLAVLEEKADESV